jgi:ATP-dependent DNA ligase
VTARPGHRHRGEPGLLLSQMSCTNRRGRPGHVCRACRSGRPRTTRSRPQAYADAVSLPASLRLPPEVALAKVVADLPEPPAMPGGCTYEPKWGGFRTVIVRAEEVSLCSRQGKNLNRYFPEIICSSIDTSVVHPEHR